MKTYKALAITGTAVLCLWPAALSVQAQEPTVVLDGHVEVGVGHSNSESFKFGEFTGLGEDGAFFIGNIDAIARDAYDDDSTYYMELYGSNLGLENRSFSLEAGSQGRFGGSIFYQQIPHYLHQDASTPYRGEGTNYLSLPPSWPAYVAPGAPDQTSSDITALGLQREIDLKTNRERFGGSLFWLPRKNWRLDVEYRNERKTGTQTTFGMFGTNGGNPLAAAIPEPVNYETNEIDAIANYTSGKFQVQASYNGSFFNDRYDSLVWQNAYWSGDNGWDAMTEEGQMALPPDNQAHSFALSGGYTVSPRTRVTGSLGYGIMLQDEEFLPYTINPAIAVGTPLPRDSLDGEVNTMRADIGISTRPTGAVDLSARYRFNDRQNDTPRDFYQPVPSDVGLQSSTILVNTPHSYTQHLANLEAGYRIGTYTRLSLEYEYENMERTFSERDRTREHTITGKLRGRASDTLNGWVSYGRAWRTGDTYVGNAPLRESEFPDPGPGAFVNHPEMRKMNIADRTEDAFKAMANWMASDRVSATFGADYTLDDYDETTIGLTEGENIGLRADLSYAASEALTTYVYYGFSQMSFEQKGHEFSPFPPLNSLTDPAQRWSIDTTDRVHSAGLGLVWSGLSDKVDLTLDYAFSHAVTAYDTAGGADLGTVSDLPDVETDIHSVQLAADYAVTAGVSVRLAYMFEYYDSEDFALDAVQEDSMSRVLWFGGGSPDYTAHVVGISTVITF